MRSTDVAGVRRLVDEPTNRFTRGHVDGGDAYFVTGSAQDVGCGLRIGLAAISEDDVLSDADAPSDGLANLAGANEDDDVAYDSAFVVLSD